MRTFCLGTILWIVLPFAHGSAVSPPGGYTPRDRRNRNSRHPIWHQKIHSDGDVGMAISRPISPEECGQSAMASVVLGQKGGAVVLLACAAVVRFRKMLKSESFGRASYFWFHAGPIVAHYKFAKWWLTKTKAPLEKRNHVYNSLHDNYCNRALQIALHLKGLYVKVSAALV
jgi:hypothetical protein